MNTSCKKCVTPSNRIPRQDQAREARFAQQGQALNPRHRDRVNGYGPDCTREQCLESAK